MGEKAREALVKRLRQIGSFRSGLACRKAELVEMPADKHGFDHNKKFSLHENKLIMEEGNG